LIFDGCETLGQQSVFRSAILNSFHGTPLFLRYILRRAGLGFTGIGARGFFLGGLPGGFRPFPLLVAAVVKLLIGQLFLHASIMSQIPFTIRNLTKTGRGSRILKGE
jgi:hypothetical protein